MEQVINQVALENQVSGTPTTANHCANVINFNPTFSNSLGCYDGKVPCESSKHVFG